MTATLKTLSLDKITSAGNVRRKVGDVRELAYSIDAVGLLNPLTVTKNGDGFELVAGHRRLAALQKLGVTEAPAYIIDEDKDAHDAQRVAVQLVENLQREDLEALEEADGLAELVELVGSQKAAAEAIGRSQAHVSKRLKLRELPEKARDAISSGELTLEDAFELSKLDDARQKKALKGLIGNGSRWELDRQLEEADRDRKSRKAAKAVAGQKHRKGVEVVAVPDVPKSWKSLEGYDGLGVDQDAHEAEPCHRLVVGYQTSWATEPSEVYYCAEPERHDPDGESENKPIVTEREREDEARREAIAERQAKAKAERQRLFAEASTVANGTARNDALKVLARFVLDVADDYGNRAGFGGDLEDVLEAVGAKLPEPPERKAWEDPEGFRAYETALREVVDGLTIAQLYRAAVLWVIAGSVFSPTSYTRAEPLAQALAGVLDVEIPETEEE